jgi:hypothetical protein
MTWAQAKIEMGRGHSVRREHWCASVRFQQGEIVWNLSERILRACNDGNSPDPSYSPYPYEEAASDWVAA